MSRLSTLLLFAATLLAMSLPASGQTTRPAVSNWQATIEIVRKAIVDSDPSQLRVVLAEKYSLHDFSGAHQGDWTPVVQQFGGAMSIGSHASLFPPLSVAAEVANDLKGAPQIPEVVRLRYLPIDEVDMKRANATAVQWLADSLSAVNGDPVGALIFWIDETASASRPEQATQSLLFVLLKGQQLPSGEYRIVKIVYGNPLATR